MATIREHGIVAITGCSPCWSAAGLKAVNEWRPGAFVTVIHASHVPEFESAGWWLTKLYDDDDVSDLVCEHLVAELGNGQRVD